MTEFEILQVEYMEKAYATSLIDNIYGPTAAMGDQATVIFTLIFGYLLVAHFMGSQLSRIQVLVLTICYLSMTIRLSIHTMFQAVVAGELQKELLNVLDVTLEVPVALQVWDKIDQPWWYFVYITASLYYMWSVRRQKPE